MKNGALLVVTGGALLLVAGCAQPLETHAPAERVSPDAGVAFITVYIEGAVNKPGERDLNRPFTIEHLILQAGGIDMYEEGHNKNMAVIHQDGHRVLVPVKDYASFVLANGDAVEVPRE